MRELAIQAANGTVNTADRATLDEEFQALIAEIDRIATQTTFNGVDLLDGTTTTLDIQVGARPTRRSTVTLADVDRRRRWRSATDVDQRLERAAPRWRPHRHGDRHGLDRARRRSARPRTACTSAIAAIASARENLSAAESRIRDVDVATETADLTRNSILQQAAVSVLAQANAQPQLALALLQG